MDDVCALAKSAEVDITGFIYIVDRFFTDFKEQVYL